MRIYFHVFFFLFFSLFIQYQEEVINNIWMNFEKQKAVLEERDETIDSLYERLTAAENAAKRGPITSISHPVS